MRFYKVPSIVLGIRWVLRTVSSHPFIGPSRGCLGEEKVDVSSYLEFNTSGEMESRESCWKRTREVGCYSLDLS